ncbi:MFS general substrate transporter [Irpex rosettiformis]|uniref:MFS general substrate transporter n=1 Tax=Irpex rosettiformis TaxID=378272 RepID=A0ACB8TQ53_9APHY|nr:MFS general substrate transporter [Irpex rosettiformis]
MSRTEEPPYQPTDPIISSNFGPYTPSPSRVRQAQHSRENSQHGSPSHLQLNASVTPSESAPLLGSPHTKKPFYRPRPLWLVPFGIVASIVRGMTLAPRVQVFTQLSCNEFYGHDVYDHTSHSAINVTIAHPSPQSSHVPLHSSLDPFGPYSDRSSIDIVFTPSDGLLSGTSSAASATDDENNPRASPSQKCLSDPRVQSKAAKLQTIMTITMGALSALSTGWWGHFGERYGRMRVLAAATLGLFLTDLTFILVSTPHSIFARYGNVLLVVAPTIEGLLGGWSTLQGATSAYISDCTSDGSRAQVFSRFTGVFYLGFSVGPALGAYLIRHPLFQSPSTSSGSLDGPPPVTSAFYVAAMASFVNLLLVLFIFPESLRKKKTKGGLQYSAVPCTTAGSENLETSLVKRFFGPLALLAPKKAPRLDGGYSRDWSLTILSTSFFLYLLAMGIFQIKYLYAEHVYHWTAEQLSYYITFVGGIRAVQLLFIMPYIISTCKPKPKQKEPQSVSSSVAVHHSGSPKQHGSVVFAHAKDAKPSLGRLKKEMSFDVLLLRLSLLIDFFSHTLVSLSPADAGQALFVGFTALSSLGSGVQPGVNSLALCILQMRAQASGQSGNGEGDGGVGRLFGALASLQAVGQMILGPLMFGVIYSSTVANFPKAIFVTAACTLFTALILLSFLRPDVALRVKRRVRQDDESERGRSRISKDLGRSSQAFASEPSSSGSARSL